MIADGQTVPSQGISGRSCSIKEAEQLLLQTNERILKEKARWHDIIDSKFESLQKEVEENVRSVISRCCEADEEKIHKSGDIQKDERPSEEPLVNEDDPGAQELKKSEQDYPDAVHKSATEKPNSAELSLPTQEIECGFEDLEDLFTSFNHISMGSVQTPRHIGPEVPWDGDRSSLAAMPSLHNSDIDDWSDSLSLTSALQMFKPSSESPITQQADEQKSESSISQLSQPLTANPSKAPPDHTDSSLLGQPLPKTQASHSLSTSNQHIRLPLLEVPRETLKSRQGSQILAIEAYSRGNQVSILESPIHTPLNLGTAAVAGLSISEDNHRLLYSAITSTNASWIFHEEFPNGDIRKRRVSDSPGIRGISLHSAKELIAVAFEEKGDASILLYSLDGLRRLKTIRTRALGTNILGRPRYLAWSLDGEYLYVSDSGKEGAVPPSVMCLHMSGKSSMKWRCALDQPWNIRLIKGQLYITHECKRKVTILSPADGAVIDTIVCAGPAREVFERDDGQVAIVCYHPQLGQ